MTKASPRFDADLERAILSRCLENSRFLAEATRVAGQHDFSSRPLGWIFGELACHYKRRREVMSGRTLLARLKAKIKDPEKRDIYVRALREVVKADAVDAGAALDLLRDFVRFQRLHATAGELIDRLEAGDLDAAESTIARQSRQHVGGPEYERLDWWGSFKSRLDQTRAEIEAGKRLRIRTGIRRLDRVILGNHLGELGMLLATTGKGKTILLLNFTVAAALQGYGGIFFALEMPARQICRRLDSRILKTPYARLRAMDFSADEDEELSDMHARRRRLFEGQIDVVSVPVNKCSTTMLEEIIEERRAEGLPVDFVMWDSLDHVKVDGRKRYESKRVEATDVYWWAKGLAMGTPDIPGHAAWTSCHAGREWRYRIATPEAAAEAYDKSRIADTVVSINQSRAEEKVGLMTAYLAKYREGPSWIKIPLSTNFALMTFRELREAERAELAGEEEEDE